MLNIRNQTETAIDKNKIKKIYQKTLKAHNLNPQNCDCGLHFVKAAKIQKLNRRFRGLNKTTDVLSFPIDEPIKTNKQAKIKKSKIVLGDIFISPAMVRKKIGIEKTFLHGLLHLLGLSHSEMKKRIP